MQVILHIKTKDKLIQEVIRTENKKIKLTQGVMYIEIKQNNLYLNS